jgi:hypothetical protein
MIEEGRATAGGGDVPVPHGLDWLMTPATAGGGMLLIARDRHGSGFALAVPGVRLVPGESARNRGRWRLLDVGQVVYVRDVPAAIAIAAVERRAARVLSSDQALACIGENGDSAIVSLVTRSSRLSEELASPPGSLIDIPDTPAQLFALVAPSEAPRGVKASARHLLAEAQNSAGWRLHQLSMSDRLRAALLKLPWPSQWAAVGALTTFEQVRHLDLVEMAGRIAERIEHGQGGAACVSSEDRRCEPRLSRSL